MEALKYRLTKPYLSDEELRAVEEVLDSGWLAEGKQTEKFEKKLAKTVGADHAVAVSNCTVAIELALRAHKVHGNVAIPDFTHPATALAVINAGAQPILCDVDLHSYNINSTLEAEVSVPVSWAGNPIKDYPNGLVIEDAACSLGAANVGSKHTTCFSFHPRKLVTTGEGGAVTTNDPKIAERIRQLKNFGKDGGNYRLNDIASAIGFIQLGKIPEIIQARRRTAKIYDDMLAKLPHVEIPVQNGGTYQTYAVRLLKGHRNQIIRKLAAKGIETQIGTYALHLFRQFQKLPRTNELPVSTLLYRTLLALPMAYDLTEEDQKIVVSELCHCLNG